MWIDGIQIGRLIDLESIVVETVNTVYEITVISARDGDVLVRGGRRFPENTPARILGASRGGAILKLSGIYVGFEIELLINGRRIVSSPVRSIRLEMRQVLSRSAAF